MKNLDGALLKKAMISGANNISIYRKEVDELNVFPVPDGDTGTNMSMTIQSGAKVLKQMDDSLGVGDVSKAMSSALLRGARGNSGVILSLLFRGFSKALENKKVASAKDIAKAMELGVEAAYKAVMNPTEGTMLTVARVAGEKAAEAVKTEDDPVKLWDIIVDEARATLATTPDLLPVLKKAGVVDAGGEGVCIIFEGMKQVFHGGDIIEWESSTSVVAAAHQPGGPSKSAAGNIEMNIEFGYCTEFIINRENGSDPIKLRAYLETIGDSVVVVDDDDIIKVHVHTNEPGNAIQQALKFGPLTSMKIDNMREQHTSKILEVQQTKASAAYVPVDPSIKYGFVAISAGKGLDRVFLDLGCSKIVSGGQTMNPSTDDILAAVQQVPAGTVFVLPNNKNIIMAAEQVIPLVDRKVIVLPTTTIPQGMSAMLAFDADKKPLENEVAMKKAMSKVSTGQLTFAARDSEFEGHRIKEGEILALDNGKLAFVETDLAKAALKLGRSVAGKKSSFVTIIYGKDVSIDEAEKFEEALSSKLGSGVDVMLINGGQPVYYYIIAAE